MITGFITDNQTADAILDGIAQAFIDRELPQFWTLGKMPIYAGPHAGSVFLPADDQILSTPLRGNPPLTPTDFPEFATLVALLGGLESRQSIDPACLKDPNAELP